MCFATLRPGESHSLSASRCGSVTHVDAAAASRCPYLLWEAALTQPVQPIPDPCRNAKGYDVAETFRSKLTHISPVWLQLREEEGSLVVTGQHNIDKGWVQRLRQPPPEVSPAQQVTACSLRGAALWPSSWQCH